jgi:hypothetical protein
MRCIDFSRELSLLKELSLILNRCTKGAYVYLVVWLSTSMNCLNI